MAVRGPGAARRRLRRRVALVGALVGLVLGVALALLGGGGAVDALVLGLLAGAVVAVAGAAVVALLPTTNHGPPGQH